MKIKIIKENFNYNIFNQKAFHPLQSWEWGEARQEMGIKIIRLGEYDNEKLKNVYSISIHKIPFTNFKIGYLPRSVFPSKEILNFLTDYSKRNQVVFIKIEPYVKKDEFLSLKINYDINLIKSPHPLFPSWTQILKLDRSEDELLKNMHPKTRYNIRLAQKKGVIIKQMTNEEGFKIFSQLYFETCKRQKYFGHNLNYHQIVFKKLKKKIAYILIAFYKNQPLAAYQLWIFKNNAFYVYGGSTDRYRNLMASNLLMWEAIKFAKNKGAKNFDMWGSLSPNYSLNHPWAGFTRFKQGYGGDFVEMVGSYDLIIYPIIYYFYNFLYYLRNIYLKFIKLF